MYEGFWKRMLPFFFDRENIQNFVIVNLRARKRIMQFVLYLEYNLYWPLISRLRIFIHDEISNNLPTIEYLGMLRFKEKNQEIYKICKDFSKLIEKKDDKRFYTRFSIICINNPATRRESGK